MSRRRPAAGGNDPRVRRMLRWYPRAWRDRYGAEFAELLAADLAERPRSWQRTADLARCGLRARLAAAGLSAHPLDPAAAERAGLSTLAGSAAVFFTFGATMWAQLAVGWQWQPPAARATRVAITVMSASMLLFAVLGAAAAAPLVWTAVRACARGRARAVLPPVLMALTAAVVLVIGGRHFGNGWPGTGGHWPAAGAHWPAAGGRSPGAGGTGPEPGGLGGSAGAQGWPWHGLVPGGIAAFAWACTLAVTSYWAHPAALASFPPAEVAWMAASPVAIACLVAGVVRLVRGLDWTAAAMRYQARLGVTALAGMTVFLSAGLCWLLRTAPGGQGPFHAGIIDVAGLAVMAVTLATGGLALYRAGRSRPTGGGPLASAGTAR